jgi:hypothetical protein
LAGFNRRKVGNDNGFRHEAPSSLFCCFHENMISLFHGFHGKTKMGILPALKRVFLRRSAQDVLTRFGKVTKESDPFISGSG